MREVANGSGRCVLEVIVGSGGVDSVVNNHNSH